MMLCERRMKITGMSTYEFRMRWRKTSILGQSRAIEIENSTALGQSKHSEDDDGFTPRCVVQFKVF